MTSSSALSQDGDDLSQGKQRFVDVDALLGLSPLCSGLSNPLRPCQVDQFQFRTQNAVSACFIETFDANRQDRMAAGTLKV